MSTIFVSRHKGALDWINSVNIHIDEFEHHLSIDRVNKGDVIVGTQPIPLVAKVCDRGARYLHLDISIPPSLRGIELTREILNRLGAQLIEYKVSEMPVESAQVLSQHDST